MMHRSVSTGEKMAAIRFPQMLARTLMLCALTHCTLHAGAPTFQDLMDPSVFPEAQRGMIVESATASPDELRIVTTGAEFTLDGAGNGVFRQRVGHPREIARIRIEGIAGTPALTHSAPGLAFARFDSPKLDLRVNGDSLFMFHAHEPVDIEVTRAIDVGFTASHKSNCIVLDEWGGFGLFGSDPSLESALTPYEPVVARYTLPADAVLWIGICPPKPYDWERSLRDNVVWHWSNQLGYPPDSDLIAWSKEGNTVLLQSEVMLWKDWNLAFVPRLGDEEFARVRKTIHDHGMRFIVYTSPYYFLKGTPIESKAMNSFDNFSVTGFPPGWPEGVNMDLFMDEITKVMTHYKPDGQYFDGQYTENTAALYALARRTRALLGEEGILEWHSTFALGTGLCFLPQADAYVDFILRGEGRDSTYTDFNYLRYFVSCYNSSNSIGVLCNNGPKPTADLAERLLSANCRMHTLAGWLADPGVMEVVHNSYREHLTAELRERVERGVDERQAQVAEAAKARAQEYQALRTPPGWDQPALIAHGPGFLEWTQTVSPANQEPFADQDGALAITAKAHTYAFLSSPLGAAAHGFVIRLKQNTDGGMSWGPAVCLRWKAGTHLRVGLRSDGSLQADLGGEQHLFGKHDPSQWTWIRVRWLQHSGVVEASANGKDYEPVWFFEHGGTLTGPVESIAVGKIPYSGAPVDHTDPGAAGTCRVGEVAIY
ncbi:MAG: hypothetical protein IT364_27505 [Candidatus Hydrogenedentes bacterium]|nr:hypothetical protein [Candidatus Hydrogenedentota bacterium]